MGVFVKIRYENIAMQWHLAEFFLGIRRHYTLCTKMKFLKKVLQNQTRQLKERFMRVFVKMRYENIAMQRHFADFF